MPDDILASALCSLPRGLQFLCWMDMYGADRFGARRTEFFCERGERRVYPFVHVLLTLTLSNPKPNKRNTKRQIAIKKKTTSTKIVCPTYIVCFPIVIMTMTIPVKMRTIVMWEGSLLEVEEGRYHLFFFFQF